ncbi:MAG: hypothetical protein HRU19_23065 [Pseudobacteriovorax sp.]|nr:hypothetical protein [Pseudobacteriovorax sp.]
MCYVARTDVKAEMMESIGLRPNTSLPLKKKLVLTCLGLGFLSFAVSFFGAGQLYPGLMLFLSLGLISIGALVHFYQNYNGKEAGIRNNHITSMSITSRGAWAWVAGVVVTGFYVLSMRTSVFE